MDLILNLKSSIIIWIKKPPMKMQIFLIVTSSNASLAGTITFAICNRRSLTLNSKIKGSSLVEKLFKFQFLAKLRMSPPNEILIYKLLKNDLLSYQAISSSIRSMKWTKMTKFISMNRQKKDQDFNISMHKIWFTRKRAVIFKRIPSKNVFLLQKRMRKRMNSR